VFLVQLYDISIAYAPCTKTSNVERVERDGRTRNVAVSIWGRTCRSVYAVD
jgi:hypothetical protein